MKPTPDKFLTFPVATALDLAIANKLENLPPPEKPERKTYKHFTRTAKGTQEVLPKTKEKMGLYRTKSEGRNRQIMPTRARVVKLKDEFWTSRQITQWFSHLQFIADKKERGWFFAMNKPNRKLSQADQIEIMIQDDNQSHLVHFNMDQKHFIIESLVGNE